MVDTILDVNTYTDVALLRDYSGGKPDGGKNASLSAHSEDSPICSRDSGVSHSSPGIGPASGAADPTEPTFYKVQLHYQILLTAGRLRTS
jgi:hypothetical protein